MFRTSPLALFLALCVSASASDDAAPGLNAGKRPSAESTPVADAPASKDATPENPAQQAEISELIAELDGAEFASREQATRKLVKIGAPVIDAVAHAADSDNLEVASRCINVLKELYQSPDAATKEAARGGLSRLSESANRSVARRAHAILHPPEPARLRANGRMPGGRARNGVQQIQVQSRNINGNLQVDVQENERKIQITHNVGNDIIIKVTDGGLRPQTTEYRGKDLAELKQKQPEAAQLYETYASDQNNRNPNLLMGRVVFQRLQFPIAAPFGAPAPVEAPAPAPQAPDAGRPDADRPDAALKPLGDANLPGNAKPPVDDAAAALKEISTLTDRLKVLSSQDTVDTEQLKKVADQLEAARARLAKAQQGTKP